MITKEQLDLIPDEKIAELIAIAISIEESFGSNALIDEIKELIKPKKKIIDLSVLVGSDIDCDFSDSLKYWYCSKLKDIDVDNDFTFIDHHKTYWRYCRPRMDHWMGAQDKTEDGGFKKCPIPQGFKIQVFDMVGIRVYSPVAYNDGWVTCRNEQGQEFTIDWSVIAEVKILGLADGYRY